MQKGTPAEQFLETADRHFKFDGKNRLTTPRVQAQILEIGQACQDILAVHGQISTADYLKIAENYGKVEGNPAKQSLWVTLSKPKVYEFRDFPRGFVEFRHLPKGHYESPQFFTEPRIPQITATFDGKLWFVTPDGKIETHGKNDPPRIPGEEDDIEISIPTRRNWTGLVAQPRTANQESTSSHDWEDVVQRVITASTFSAGKK